MFDQAIEHFGEIISLVNQRFSSHFEIFPDQDDEVKDAVISEIDARNRELDKGKVTHLYRPDKDKEALKNAVDLQETSELYLRALSIYQKYTEL
jgi:hypothetical protein